MNTTKKIYVCASFAYESKKKTNERKKLIEETVERIKKVLPGDYYLPHKLKINDAWNMSLVEWSNQVYSRDVYNLKYSDIVIFLSFGKGNNDGSAWEIGWTAGYRNLYDMLEEYVCDYVPKKVIVVKMNDEPESIMIYQSVDAIIFNKDIEAYNWNKLPLTKVTLNKLS